ncbi:SDR family oxidoreductase [Pseudonocardia sp. HH130630-07]|uniref:SDR family oxidoreductase n=1 Tax=Pseudonocardia sp. HH130630-07 TaxID=1690815 RepID=UPI0008151FBD|nr:SDR family oxidoreductase [Pseudonocardia sp. HH130630-07]ANY06997.1 3-oxoacyl-ACP reductase [Pseudonocardia sp. HH130630-07]
MDIGLRDRVALVLGSTAGLGRASAAALAAEGARVVVTGRRAERVDEVVASLPGSTGVVADLTEPDAPARLAAAARAAFGRIDVLVLNGGGPAPGAPDDFTAADAAAAVELLLAPHVALVGQVLPEMRRAGWGRIVAIGSSGIQQPIPALTASNVGRAALAAYLKTLAGRVAVDGVTVNTVLPGRIDTDRVAHLDRIAAERAGTTPEQARAGSEGGIPAGRYGTPDEFGAVVAFLAGTGAGYVTGSQIRCDGGLVAAP